MADTKLEKPQTRGLRFPIAIEAGGRQFTLQSADTVRVWELYGQYESLIIPLVSADPDAPPKLTREAAGDIIRSVIDMCELCHDENGNPVIFKNTFGPGDQTPRILWRKVMKVLFADFLASSGDEDFRPLIMDLASPLEGQT